MQRLIQLALQALELLPAYRLLKRLAEHLEETALWVFFDRTKPFSKIQNEQVKTAQTQKPVELFLPRLGKWVGVPIPLEHPQAVVTPLLVKDDRSQSTNQIIDKPVVSAVTEVKSRDALTIAALAIIVEVGATQIAMNQAKTVFLFWHRF